MNPTRTRPGGATRRSVDRGPVLAAIRALLITLTLLVAPAATAQALTPPRVDDRWLPAPAPPAPPEPTVQQQPCPVLADDPGLRRPAVPTQLDGLDLVEVWPLTRGVGVRVAVIDTGVTPHRRLADLVPGGDYVATGAGDRDCDGHGTLVAGIIAATPESGAGDFAGVAPGATVISIRQSSSVYAPAGDPARPGVGDVDTMASAVRTAADLGAAVINISVVACLGAEAPPDDRALGAALAYAVDVKNAVVVAAAGNTDGPDGCPRQPAGATWATATVVASPAWYDDYVLTVGSVGRDGQPSAFTLPGPWLDVAAPGEAVVSLSPTGDGLVDVRPGPGGREPIHGTSYAAPVVSGLAALIRSRFPDWTARQVMQRIKETAHPPPTGWNPAVGHGVIDPLAAVSAADPPAAETAPAPPAAPPTPTAPRTSPTSAASPTSSVLGVPTTLPAPLSPAAPFTPAAPLSPAGPAASARHTPLTGAAGCLALAAAAAAAWSWHARPGRDDRPGD